MSFREQISELIYDCRDRIMNNGKVELTEEYYVDKILELFEKRIDLIHQSEELNYHGDEVDWGINLFYKKIKEMLK